MIITFARNPVVLNPIEHGLMFYRYWFAAKVLHWHLTRGHHDVLSNLVYKLRRLLARVRNFADSAEESEELESCILNVALTNGWTFGQLKIFPSSAPFVRGDCEIHGSHSNIRVTKHEFEHEKLMWSGMPVCVNFPTNTHLLIMDKVSHVFSNDIVPEMFKIAERRGINLVFMCCPGSMNSYQRRILYFASAHDLAVSIWPDVDSGGKTGSRSFSNMRYS